LAQFREKERGVGGSKLPSRQMEKKKKRSELASSYRERLNPAVLLKNRELEHLHPHAGMKKKEGGKRVKN